MKSKTMLIGISLTIGLILALVWLSGNSQPARASALEPQPAAPVAVINACGAIAAPTTWTSGNVYVANGCNVVVNPGVILTIQAGAIVKFGGPTFGLIVNGNLAMEGTQANPAVITSYKDDAHGGDTNNDEFGTASAGDWYGIHFSAGSRGRINYAFIGYGAPTNECNSIVCWNRGQIRVVNADFQMRNSLVTAGKKPGIYIEGAGLSPVFENVQVTNHISGDPAYPAYAIYQSTVNMTSTYHSLNLTGNDSNAVTILWGNEQIEQDVTFTDSGAPYRFDCHYTGCTQWIPAGKTLTINPGTELQYDHHYNSFRIVVLSGGTLLAEGTVAQPITFTSGMPTPQAGDWQGIQVQANATARLSNCDISYGGGYYHNLPALDVSATDVQVRNCRIHHNAGNGLYIYSSDASSIHPTLTNVDVTDNGQYGVYLDTSYGSTNSVTWDGGSISRNGWSGVSGRTSFSSIYPTFTDLTISDNGSLGDADSRRKGIAFEALNHGINPVLENVTFSGNVGTAMTWYCDGSITARNLTATGNGADELELPGCSVGSGRQWDLGDVGIPVRVTGDIEVTTNGLLSIMPGTTLRFDKNWAGNPTYLTVQDQAALYALGTADKPVVFTGATETPGWWTGIEVIDRASVTLRHCEIAYGGGNYGSLHFRWGLSGGVPSAYVQNCEIHHSASKGVHFDFNNYQVSSPPVFRDNSIHDNAEEGVTNWNAPALDARYNWWGDASGPYNATTNPGGGGENVGDNVLFDPWLTAPPTGGTSAGQMLVITGAPHRVSSGQTADYAIQYLNLMTGTVQNAVLVVQLPREAEYVDSTGGGIYWPERDQVFWKLGDLAPGAQDFLSFTVRFQWGLPRDYQDSSITIFTADNYNPGEIDTQGYLDYAPGEVSAVSLLTTEQFSAQLAASPDLQAAYDAAIAAGYTFHTAANVTRSEGETVLEAVMVNVGLRASKILAQQGGHVLVYTINAGEVIIADSAGGMRLDLITGEKSVWGTWESDTALGSVSFPASVNAGCTVDACKSNCRWSIVGWEYIKKKAGRVVAWTAFSIFTGGGGIPGAVWEIGSTAKKLYDCDLDCRANPSEYCCTAGQVRWSGGGLFGGLTNSCYKEKCNATVGVWVPDGYKTCVAFGQRCVAGIGGPGCTPCEEHNTAQSYETRSLTVAAPVSAAESEGICSAATSGGNPRCRDLEILWAKDPNAIYGPVGDLLPGATVDYTITYENEGAGRAYLVYVINELPDVFDEATLDLNGAGTYLAASREIFWLVGELGPKGDPDSKGIITYTVNLKTGLPSGAVVSNQAIVYFPSVPEETPTNTWVNLVAPLAAIPQVVETDYMTPLAITLTGREVSGLPLTYEIAEHPHGGTLSGTPPNLTYTPFENFTGADGFTFRVSNGTSTSRAAQVYIDVTSVGDATPPQVLWTSPAADATDVTASTTPVFTDTTGPVYSPLILIGVSEALSETTVTTATVTLVDSQGTPVTGTVRFDGGVNQIIFAPHMALDPGSYTATVTTGVADLAGNSLAAPHIWTFEIKAATPPTLYLPLVIR